jgi:hypothetical protein
VQSIAYRLPKPSIIWSTHVEDKFVTELSRLGFAKADLEAAVLEPDEVLSDAETGRKIALKHQRKLAVIFESRGVDIFIITAIYSSKLERVVSNRKRSGRWL